MEDRKKFGRGSQAAPQLIESDNNNIYSAASTDIRSGQS